MTISFFHQCNPPTATAQTRRHTRTGKTYLPPATARAAAMLQAIMEPHKPAAPLTGPVYVEIFWTYPGKNVRWRTQRPDLDNLAKLTLDGMTKAGYWLDDAQVVVVKMAKMAGPIAGIAVLVEKIGPDWRLR